MGYWFGRLICFVFRWNPVGELPKDTPHAVFIAAPHTSNWDLVFMLASALVLRIPLGWVGKNTMFEVPLLGWYLKRMGGVSIVRDKGLNQVEQMARAIKDADEMYLALAPSGTRGLRDHWKSGFYRVAMLAEVPIVCGFLDYRTRSGGVGPVVYPTGDIQADMDLIREFYDPIVARRPELKSTIRLKDEAPAA